MKPHQRKADIKLSNLQDTLIKGVSALTTASNDLLVCRETKTLPNYKDLLSQLLDATALFGHVCQELSFKRKETIKPILHPDFKSVCSRTHKVGRLLFGKDLAKVVQDLRASTKVVTQLTSFVPQGNQSSVDYNGRQSAICRTKITNGRSTLFRSDILTNQIYTKIPLLKFHHLIVDYYSLRRKKIVQRKLVFSFTVLVLLLFGMLHFNILLLL